MGYKRIDDSRSLHLRTDDKNLFKALAEINSVYCMSMQQCHTVFRVTLKLHTYRFQNTNIQVFMLLFARNSDLSVQMRISSPVQQFVLITRHKIKNGCYGRCSTSGCSLVPIICCPLQRSKKFTLSPWKLCEFPDLKRKS